MTNRRNRVASLWIDGPLVGGQIARILIVCNLFETRQACRFISAADWRRASRELYTLKAISVSATCALRLPIPTNINISYFHPGGVCV